MTTVIKHYNTQVLETIRDASRFNKWWSAPLNLGGCPGPGGGSGLPIGGIYSQLIQTKVAYDTTEAAYRGILTNVPSGTLVDNLAHIRHDLLTVSGIAASGNMLIRDEGVDLGRATIVNFVGEGVTASWDATEVKATVEIPSGVWTPLGNNIHLRTGYVNVGIGLTTGIVGRVHIDQAIDDATIPVLVLDQADISEGFINFIGSDRGVIDEAVSSAKSVRVELGGVVYRIALYADA